MRNIVANIVPNFAHFFAIMLPLRWGHKKMDAKYNI